MRERLARARLSAVAPTPSSVSRVAALELRVDERFVLVASLPETGTVVVAAHAPACSARHWEAAERSVMDHLPAGVYLLRMFDLQTSEHLRAARSCLALAGADRLLELLLGWDRP